MVTISYAITVCNEHVEIQKLLPYLLAHKRLQDQVVILFDAKNGSQAVEDYLRAKSVESNPGFYWWKDNFNGHFADWKNKLKACCTGDFIFQIDADEYPSNHLFDLLPQVLENNPEVDLYYVPRINTVSGITQEHIQKWGWNVNDQGWVNFPDYQTRIYRKSLNIKWENKVHERIVGFNQYAPLPAQEPYCLHHHKTIERQERQNNYYDTL